ncbi:MAG: signal peptidase I [Gammaproteobacteria bacterium]|nr:signal peptidase I [Gammaproteobacteria bacterium]NNF59792.1 signal peptidase I [Gammaproteobacteria bacterium]NNM20986.1 signal peptidase I [Gammaproteobacteria bacterium]
MFIELVLVGLALLTGLIWGVDHLFFRARRLAGTVDNTAPEPVVVEYARSFFPIILIVLVIRSFLFEPFRIPSDSMMPTLLDGDFIFVNKYTYGLRLPVSNTRLVKFSDPDRGDVVVFRLPTDPGTNFIKRVVGLPGDKVEYRNKQLFVNGERIPSEVNGVYDGPGNNLPSGRYRPRVVHEELNGIRHDILLSPGRNGKEGVFVVPEGHYFLMGDNRDNSHDSRYPGVGFIPESKLVGKAVRIWMNWNLPHAAPIWNRVGDQII